MRPVLVRINRDVIVFVISFIQELLPFQAETKMTDVYVISFFDCSVLDQCD